MLFFKPTEKSENEYLFEAFDGEEKKGEGMLVVEGNYAKVTSLSFDEKEPFIAEGLLRAAFNLATGKNCYMGICRCKNADKVLSSMNFLKEKDYYINDIPSILRGSCCKKG